MKRLHEIIFVALASVIFASVIFMLAKFNKVTDQKLGYDGNTIVTSGGSSSSGGGGGIGTITGPASSTDNALVIWRGILGVSTTNSNITLSSSTNDIVMPALGTVDGRDLSVDGAKLDLLPSSALSLVGVSSTSFTQRSRINFFGINPIVISGQDNTSTNSTDVSILIPGLATTLVSSTLNTPNATTTAIGPLITIPPSTTVSVAFRIVGRLSGAAFDGSIVSYGREFVYANATGTIVNVQNQLVPGTDTESASPTNMAAANLPAPTIATNTVQINVTGIAGTPMTWTEWLQVRVNN